MVKPSRTTYLVRRLTWGMLFPLAIILVGYLLRSGRAAELVDSIPAATPTALSEYLELGQLEPVPPHSFPLPILCRRETRHCVLVITAVPGDVSAVSDEEYATSRQASDTAAAKMVIGQAGTGYALSVLVLQDLGDSYVLVYAYGLTPQDTLTIALGDIAGKIEVCTATPAQQRLEPAQVRELAMTFLQNAPVCKI